jgi:NAD(P)-dependent dehydrogenase (short-subunit alcohol dehydrogenase family)
VTAFTRETTTDDVLRGVDLTGRTIVVTGASSGLGEETARALAAHGATVVATARDAAKGEAALARLRAAHPEADVRLELLDLASLRSVRDCAERIRAGHDRVHGIVANAGVMAAPYGETEEGFELQFGSNHLGHFALVTDLTDELVAGAPSRVVVLSSAAHRWGDIDLDDPNFRTTPYRKFRAYGASKTANVLFAVELDRRMRDRGVRAFAVHPGGIHTNLGRHLTDEDQNRISVGAAATGTSWKTVPQGAATSVWALTSPDLVGRGGLYLEDCRIADVVDTEHPVGVRSFALDQARAQRLWDLSEQLIASAQ